MQNTKKYLILHLGSLGDFILTLHSLKTLNKSIIFDVCCKQNLGKLAKHLNAAQNNFDIENKTFSSLFSDEIDPSLSNFFKKYDKILLFSFSKELENNLKKICPNKDISKINPRPNPNEKIHVVDYLLKQFAQKLPDEIQNDKINFSYASNNKFFKNNDMLQNTKSIFIHPGSGSKRKNWPLANFLKLENSLTNYGFNINWLIGPAETDLIENLKNTKSNLIVCDNLIKIVNLLKKKNCIFIGNDSGLSHLAAFIGIQTIAIFGPSDSFRWKPLGKNVYVVKNDSCKNFCFEIKDKNCEHVNCLNKIPSKDIENILIN